MSRAKAWLACLCLGLVYTSSVLASEYKVEQILTETAKQSIIETLNQKVSGSTYLKTVGNIIANAIMQADHENLVSLGIMLSKDEYCATQVGSGCNYEHYIKFPFPHEIMASVSHPDVTFSVGPTVLKVKFSYWDHSGDVATKTPILGRAKINLKPCKPNDGDICKFFKVTKIKVIN